MSTKAHYFRIGLFVLIGIILIVAGVIVFGAGSLFRREVMIETYIDESVQGLDVGAPVKYRGVQIGQVKQIGLVSRLYLAGKTDAVAMLLGRDVVVRMGIVQLPRLGKSPSVEEVQQLVNELAADGLRVRLASQGITGVAYMEMDFISNPPPLSPLIWEPQYPYLPSAPSTASRFVQSAEEVLDKLSRTDIDGLVADARNLIQGVDKSVKAADLPGLRREASDMIHQADGLVADARGAIKDLQVAAIRENIVGFVSELRKTNQDLQAILAKVDVEPILANAREAAAKINSFAGRLDAMLSDEETKSIFRNLAATSEELAAASRELPETVRLLRRQIRQVDVDAFQADLEVTMENVRQISDSLRDLAATANRYPSGVLFGGPPPHTNLGADR